MFGIGEFFARTVDVHCGHHRGFGFWRGVWFYPWGAASKTWCARGGDDDHVELHRVCIHELCDAFLVVEK